MPNDLHLRVKFSRSELNKLYEQGAIDSNALAADTAQSTERRQIVVQAGQLEIVVGDSDVSEILPRKTKLRAQAGRAVRHMYPRWG